MDKFANGCTWFLGKVFSFCCDMYIFLEASSIYSLIIETKVVQRLIMKVGSINVCFLSCQFYYTYEICKHCALQQRKKICTSILISLLKLIVNISRYNFSGKGVPRNSVMDIHCSTAE